LFSFGESFGDYREKMINYEKKHLDQLVNLIQQHSNWRRGKTN